MQDVFTWNNTLPRQLIDAEEFPLLQRPAAPAFFTPIEAEEISAEQYLQQQKPPETTHTIPEFLPQSSSTEALLPVNEQVREIAFGHFYTAASRYTAEYLSAAGYTFPPAGEAVYSDRAKEELLREGHAELFAPADPPEEPV